MQVTRTNADVGMLFDAYRGPIRRYILRIVRNTARADDLTQETFLRASRRGDSLRDPQAALGWLYRIATNVCVDHMRSRHPETSLDGTGQAPTVCSARIPSADEIAERAETSRCVQHCLEYLPDGYRVVLLLFEGESLTAGEIATLLDLKLTTVKMRLHRARNLLRAVMNCGCTVGTDPRGQPTCEPKFRAPEVPEHRSKR